MGTVYRKTVTKPLPPAAKLIVRKGQRFAEWADARGKRRTAPVTTGQDGTDRIVVTMRTFIAKYRNGKDHVVEVATGCRDEAAARAVLQDLEIRADKVRSGLRTGAEDAVIDNQTSPLSVHVVAFLEYQKPRIGKTELNNTRSRLERITVDCRFKRLSDLTATALGRWLEARQAEGMGARTRNGYREAWVKFGNWCIRHHRLLSNPFASVPKADAKSDPRRKRRALDESELIRLLDVARRRPLQDAMTVRRGKHRGKAAADLRPETVARLERLGRERALIYKTLAVTGLRKGELASITLGQVDLDSDPAYVTLDPADEKNRQGNSIPLRSDLAAELRDWLNEKAAAVAGSGSEIIPFGPESARPSKAVTSDPGRRGGRSCQKSTALPPETPLFDVPAGLLRILNRNLKAAGIPKRDERGRTVDVHAMRTTFGTLLSKAGVFPRTAQAAMRHSAIGLTMNTYTDPKLLDVAGAVESLPALPLAADPRPDRLAATGTENAVGEFAPGFAPTPDKSATRGSDSVNLGNLGADPKKRENPRFSQGNQGFSEFPDSLG